MDLSGWTFWTDMSGWISMDGHVWMDMSGRTSLEGHVWMNVWMNMYGHSGLYEFKDPEFKYETSNKMFPAESRA